MNQHTAPQTGDGPFGLRMGMDGSELKAGVEILRPCVYRPLAVPRPHPAFHRHILTITPRAGLAAIVALSTPIPTDPAGRGLRAGFEAQVAELTAAYGESERVDAPVVGAAGGRPQDWLHALGQDAWVLLAHWPASSDSRRRHDLASITLSVGAGGPATGYLRLDYAFVNRPAAHAEIAAARAHRATRRQAA